MSCSASGIGKAAPLAAKLKADFDALRSQNYAPEEAAVIDAVGKVVDAALSGVGAGCAIRVMASGHMTDSTQRSQTVQLQIEIVYGFVE